MSDFSKEEISHLQEYPKPLRAIYGRVKEYVGERGLRPHTTTNCIVFTKNGGSNLIEMYFRKKGYIHFYVLDDDYKYFHDGENGDRHAQLRSMVASYQVISPNRGHRHFYLIVNEDGDMDELWDYMKPVLS